MMLHNEIKRLQRVNYLLMQEKGVMPFQEFKREEAIVDFEPAPQITLLMGARLIGQIDNQGRLSVDGRCYSKDKKLGFAYYVDGRDLDDINFTADVLMHQHEQFIHAMAEKLAEEREHAG
jgi:hypothetical protein